MNPKLNQIRSMSHDNPATVFHSVFHLVADDEHLRSCYHRLKGNKALGVDQQSKKDYGEHLEENLQDLRSRLLRGGYTPKPARRTWIEKPGSTEMRPLAVSCFEDKLVQLALRDLLEAVFEPAFLPCSYGYREGKSIHQCVDDLGRCIQRKKVNYVLEADIRKFFDRMNHDWLVKFVCHRVSDKRVKHLLVRLLRSGILEEGLYSPSSEGAPQGSVISPLLSNIYLHYVLDLWFEKRSGKFLYGEGYLFRYADDFVVCLQYPGDGNRLKSQLEERLKAFSLEMAEDKTALVSFGRFEEENARKAGRKPGSFEFLGFRFVCGKSRKGYFKVKRITAGARLRRALNELKYWLRKHYAWMRKGELIRAVRLKVLGHLNHFAITDNLKRCDTYLYFARRLLFRALSRKSQRRPYTWAGFMASLRYAKWPENVRLVHSIDPTRRRMVQQSLEGYIS